MRDETTSAPGSTPEASTPDFTLSRRGFAALSAASMASAAGSALAADVVESDVMVTTPDGQCDAALFHPAGKGSWPAVILFADAGGLRPVKRDMGRRLAADGYVVIVPNPYYRSHKAPVRATPFDFGKPEDRAELAALRAPMTAEAVSRDSLAYLTFLDALPQVNAKAKAGAVGYCMGGAMTMRAAAAAPDRVGAICSFHGGALVTATPDSPHLLATKIKAASYFGVATNDDEKEPETKVTLKAALDAAKLPTKIEVYEGAMHGWCVKGSAVYNEPQAERAWSEMTKLYKGRLT
ncbi:dienelactone hydrolase family protein [Phenylobacterium sp.]|uniref:dienelactone hydrolase family protein n=1 Tax=Phenylobacterium sp. TaxID=1871053 RepID=UPI0027327B86|nr:dienelactone hydrolase family protein [Phenylobacterium sp.]MDP3660171.1 dienelactone hydrolase family protein [Phenylobacterium sp.]